MRRRFTEPDEIRRTSELGQVDIVSLEDRVIGRETNQPGWRWSKDVRPVAGTSTCQFHHFGYTVSGRLRIQMLDGLELEVGPGDVYEVPPGHDAWVVGNEPWVGIAFDEVRGYARPQSDGGRRVLSAIVMTDIVDSTARAVAVGEARWREMVSQHNDVAERVIDQRGGHLVKTTGDGVLATFDSAEQAVHAAIALRDVLQGKGLDIRAGVQTGEVELIHGDVRGLAVHTAARLLATAGRGEIVVTPTVRDLLDGTDLVFEDHGRHNLKGLPGERQLFRLASRRPRAIPPAAAH